MLPPATAANGQNGKVQKEIRKSNPKKKNQDQQILYGITTDFFVLIR
jgi:hypothetical protein